MGRCGGNRESRLQLHVDVCPMGVSDAETVSSLVRQTFDEHVAASFGQDGIAEVYAYIAPQAIAERARTHTTLVAWQGTAPVGIIEVRDVADLRVGHVSMLFVRVSHMGQGIATTLMARAEAACRAAGRPTMTVNSSLNAQSFYECLGFVPTDEPRRVRGFAFIPMEKHLQLDSVPTSGEAAT